MMILVKSYCVPDQAQINALVDLAMIAAEGRGPKEIRTVTCFHAAIMGYRSLIHNIDHKTDFTKFMALCEPVWAALKTDTKLPNKLVCFFYE